MTVASLTDVSHAVVDGGPPPAPAGGRAPAGTRAWFVIYLLWMIGLAASALLLLSRGEQAGDALAIHGWILVLMCFYLSLCNGFLPMPTAWIILLAASPDYALFPEPVLNIFAVALLGSFATAMANLNEYHLLAYGFGGRWGQRLRGTNAYAWAVRWFDRAPFRVLVLVAFFPIPVDVVRWLAILRDYPRVRFGVAYFAGRAARYLIFAACSVLFTFSGAQIVLIQVGLVVAALSARLVWWWVRRVPAPPAA